MWIIMELRKTLVFHDTESWMKKAGSFDKPMGCYDGAEV